MYLPRTVPRALVLGLCIITSLVSGGVTEGRPGYGLIGYGINMDYPACAAACRYAVTAPLNCSDADMGPMRRRRKSKAKKKHKKRDMGSGAGDDDSAAESGDGWMVMQDPSPACKCNNDFYLQTVAYCTATRCSGADDDADDDAVPTWLLEHDWVLNTAGRSARQPQPKESYQQALLNVSAPPTRVLNNSAVLNYTALVPLDQWRPVYRAAVAMDQSEILHARYGLVLLLSGAVVPVGLTAAARLVPWPARLAARFRAWVVDPPAFGAAHATPTMMGGLGVVPTRGQALFLAYLWVLNVVLTAVGYGGLRDNAWWASVHEQVVTFLGNRCGVLSFANLALVALYAGRNNVLLWLTDWSRATFLLLHRWLSVICMLQAVLHSILYLYIYTQQPGHSHATESRLPYWYWGIIATLAMVVLMPASHRLVQAQLYSALFLPSHIALAVLAVLGCYLHIIFRFDRQWGYETWLYIAVAFWVFDRLARLARTLRAAAVLPGRNRLARRAFVTPIDADYYRLEIVPAVPGADRGGHVYLHFPSISTWRFWESHPFSVPGSAAIGRGASSAAATGSVVVAVEKTKSHVDESESKTQPQGGDVVSRDTDSIESPSPVRDKQQQQQQQQDPASPTASTRGSTADRPAERSTTLFIRKTSKPSGLTTRLANDRRSSSTGIPVFVEPGYGGTPTTFLQAGQPGCEHDLVAGACPDNLLCIAGGVGITAILPVLDAASSVASAPRSTRRLYWGVRSMPLVSAVEDMLGYHCCPSPKVDDDEAKSSGRGVLDRTWGQFRVSVSVGERFDLRAVLQSEVSSGVPTTVIVCGPPEMSDAVRVIVSGLCRHGAVVRLIVEDFAW